MVENISRKPFYSEGQMDDAIVRVPLSGDRATYRETVDEGGLDVGFVYGAPNDYESRTRFMGAYSDVLHNYDARNELPEILVVPEREQEAADNSDIELLEELGCTMQLPDFDLYTTAYDVRSVRDIASGGDAVHGFTSDYHGLKCELTGRKAFGGRNQYRTFAFDTDRSMRQNILKHNFFAQSADIPRQLYEIAKSESDF